MSRRCSLLLALALFSPLFAFAAMRSSPSRSLVQNSTSGARTLTVELYPFVPNFGAFRYEVTRRFARAHPDIRLVIVDLSDNYYGSFSDAYVGCAQANVYELDSVFLHDFAMSKKINPLPPARMLPDDGFLKNAVAGESWNLS